MKLDLYLPQHIHRRIDGLTHLTGETRSRIVSKLLEATCPVAGPGQVLVPLTVEILASGVEAALAHRLSRDGALVAFLTAGEKICSKATVLEPPVKEWLQYWRGDPFAAALERAFDRRALWDAARGSHADLTRLTVALEPDAAERLRTWADNVKRPAASLARLAMDPDFWPFGFVSVDVDVELRRKLDRSAQAHGISVAAEAALWVWQGAWEYETRIVFGSRRRDEHGDAVRLQVVQVLRERPLLGYWRPIYRRLLRHPADQWVFARLAWYWDGPRLARLGTTWDKRLDPSEQVAHGVPDESFAVVNAVVPRGNGVVVNGSSEGAFQSRLIQQQVESFLALERELHAKGAEEEDD